MKAAGTIVESVAAYKAGRFNRAVSRTNATNTLRDQTAEEAQIRDQARRAMGLQVAQQAGSGFEAGTGSALDALRESATNASLDILMSRKKARSSADASISQGKLAFAQGRAQAIGGAFKAMGEIADYASAGAGGG